MTARDSKMDLPLGIFVSYRLSIFSAMTSLGKSGSSDIFPFSDFTYKMPSTRPCFPDPVV